MSRSMTLDAVARTTVRPAEVAGLMRLLGAVEDERAEHEFDSAARTVAGRQLAETGEILDRYLDLLR